jgi:hypothetical protein
MGFPGMPFKKVKYTKMGRLKTREDMDNYLKNHGFISVHQATKIAERNSIFRKTTVNKIFNQMKDVSYISIWNPGNVRYFKRIGLCPKFCNTVVAKYVPGIKPTKPSLSTFCIYDASKESNLVSMLDILNHKNYRETTVFPPLLGEYMVLPDEDRRLIFWAEEKDREEEDQVEPMHELLDVQE